MFKVMPPYLVDGLVGQVSFAVRHNLRRMRNSSLDRCFSCWHTVKYKTGPPFPNPRQNICSTSIIAHDFKKGMERIVIAYHFTSVYVSL